MYCIVRTSVIVSMLTAALFSAKVDFVIYADSVIRPISPLIYGTNQKLTKTENWSLMRMGGNRMTGYNWENNASSAGEDWYNESDNYIPWSLGLPTAQSNVPALAVTSFHDSALALNAASLITLPCAGFVARDKNGAVAVNETAPSKRFAYVVNRKGTAYSAAPDTADSVIYVDEFLNVLTQKYGKASTNRGIKNYALDNEPALWTSTHPRIHPAKARAKEVADKNIALSQTVKSMDSTAFVYGPVLYGFNAYLNCQDAADWDSVKTGYRWFINYYLDRLRAASQSEGRRLLDVLDLHWYAEGTVRGTPAARMQAPRTLWDPSYRENSWIAQWFPQFLPLVPSLLKAIDTFYPGTKLAFTEYNYGGENHVSGGLAHADALGIFGKYGVYAACYWQMETSTQYTTAAFKLFRNADGQGLAFGPNALNVHNPDAANYSVYASDTTNGELHLIALNKRGDSSVTANITMTGKRSFNRARIFGFDSTSATVIEKSLLASINNNQCNVTLPPLSATHLVFYKSGTEAEYSDDQQQIYFSLFPSPFKNSVTISCHLPESAADGNVDLLTADGRHVVHIGQFHNKKVNVLNYRFNNKLAAGVYLFKLTIGQKSYVKRLVRIN
ncbi:MAG: T9SS type A sorting domain-containing protein [Fibrobacteres bacterium]|nr:T9SS type A sorting domain-containing protein [Fibrobacterota bacterium]